MRKFIVVSILEETPPQKFNKADWPLHVTLVRPFESNSNLSEIIERLEKISGEITPIHTKGKSKELFGPKGNISVTELENTPELTALHELGMRELSSLGTPVDSLGFRPHATDQKSGSISIGQEIILTSMSLVEFLEDERQILSTSAFQ